MIFRFTTLNSGVASAAVAVTAALASKATAAISSASDVSFASDNSGVYVPRKMSNKEGVAVNEFHTIEKEDIELSLHHENRIKEKTTTGTNHSLRNNRRLRTTSTDKSVDHNSIDLGILDLGHDNEYVSRELTTNSFNINYCSYSPEISKSGEDFRYLIIDCLNDNCPYDGPIGCWNTSQVTDMAYAFSATDFNRDIGLWDTAQVTTMKSMFYKAREFNRDISYWDISSVTEIDSMFSEADKFNQPIGNWDVQNISNFKRMFSKALEFNQPLDNWNVAGASDMTAMFRQSNFYQCLYSWAVKVPDNVDTYIMFEESQCSVTLADPDVAPWCQNIVDGCYRGCQGYYPVIQKSGSELRYLIEDCLAGDCPYLGDIGCWDTSQVTDMSKAFIYQPFNKDISFWDTGQVTTMSEMFRFAFYFNQDISYWNTTSLTDTYFMFQYAQDFNQPIGRWDVSSVSYMRGMLYSAEEFNQPLDDWDVSSATDMRRLLGTTDFNQCLASWANKVRDDVRLSGIFSNSQCTVKSDPQPDLGPWCQTISDGCGISETASPTENPSGSPTSNPSESPTAAPTDGPTVSPTSSPTSSPTAAPTDGPTVSPTSSPTSSPTAAPTAAPTAMPSFNPTVAPTTAPTAQPTKSPTDSPTSLPTIKPTVECVDNSSKDFDIEVDGTIKTKNCAWVASKKNLKQVEYCGMKVTVNGKSKKLSAICKETCGRVGFGQCTPEPTSAPTSSPTSSPTSAPTIVCKDKSKEFQIDVDGTGNIKTKDCNWVASKKKSKRKEYCKGKVEINGSNKKLSLICEMTCGLVGKGECAFLKDL